MENPAVPPAESFRFVARLRTRWSDEDLQGVLNNAVYPTLLEEARLEYFRRLGAMQGRRFPFVLAQLALRYLAPGSGGEEVLVGVRTTALGRTSFVQAYRVASARGGAPWCEAEARLVAVDERNAKRELEPALRVALAAFEGL